MSGNLMKTLGFFIKATLLALVALCITNATSILKSVWIYMTTVDLGYMWMINCGVGFVSACVALMTMTGENSSMKKRIVATITFIIVSFVCECFIWHSKDLKQIVAMKVSKEMVIYVMIGTITSTAVYMLSLHSKTPKEK